jgi:hypothetical protein
MEIVDILKERCCMCPNEDRPSNDICPGIPGTPHPQKSECGFVVSYFDDKGNTVFVSTGLWNTGKTFMSFRRKQKAGKGTHRVVSKNLPERKTFDEARTDLNKYAGIKGWKRI